MPNYCAYSMKITGNKADCKKFVDKMNDYNEENHFYRIFGAEVYDEYGTEDKYTMYLYGDCAWSLESCCRASGYSDGVDLFEVNTADLQLEMEAWSQEPGVGFEEHYVYDKGTCLVDECADADFWWGGMIDDYDSYEEFKEEYPNAPSEEEFREARGEDIIIGGFDNYGEWTI